MDDCFSRQSKKQKQTISTSLPTLVDLVSRDKKGFRECGMGTVYLLLSAGSQKRGLHSEGSAQLSHTQLFDGDPVKNEELHYEALNQVISIK